MTKNEIVGRLRDGGLDASSTNRSAAVYVADAREGRAAPGWFAYRIICDSDATERRASAILSRWYDIEASGNVWRLRSRNSVPLMAIKRGGVPPTPPTGEYMYFEAVQADSTVSMMSTLPTAPNLEYSTDGETFQEWQHTTADGVHTFDTITLGAVGDKVYLRGDNPNGLGTWTEEMPSYSHFDMTGKIAAGGNIMSLLDKDAEMTEIPAYGFVFLFGDATEENPNTSLTSAAAILSVTTIGAYGCYGMYAGGTSLTAAAATPAVTAIGADGCSVMYSGCTSLASAAAMPAVTAIGEDGCAGMYTSCTFNMSNDGTTLNFDFPTPPITAGETTYSTAYDVAEWMGNTNGFTNP